MSTAKPQRTKGKPAQAKAPHEHTPGPWTVQWDESGLYIRMEPLGDKDEYLAVYASPDKEQREADAYLIAAVPELLKALIEIESGTSARPARLIARAAIAKAKPS